MLVLAGLPLPAVVGCLYLYGLPSASLTGSHDSAVTGYLWQITVRACRLLQPLGSRAMHSSADAAATPPLPMDAFTALTHEHTFSRTPAGSFITG